MALAAMAPPLHRHHPGSNGCEIATAWPLESPTCAPASSTSTSATCTSSRPPRWRAWRAGGAALGLPPALLKSSALRDWETRVAGKGDVPCGARAAEVGGAPPCLVELRMPAGSAEPWLRAQLQPRSIGRPVRHETQNMPLCWPWPAGPLAGPRPQDSLIATPGAGGGPSRTPGRRSRQTES
jgi:hypothetical protein